MIFDGLVSYLNGQTAFDKDMLDAINFMDHCLREKPSQTMTAIKRSFFKRPKNVHDLKGHLEAWKGIFATIRAVNRNDGPGLSVNVDVSNGCFWKPLNLHVICWSMCGYEHPTPFGQDFQRYMRLNMGEGMDKSLAGKAWIKSDMYGRMKKLRKVSVIVRGRGENKPEIMMINDFPGYDCDSYRFTHRDAKTGDEKLTTLYNYMNGRYHIDGINRLLPVVEMTKRKTVMPMDFCQIIDCQRYPFKLDDKETSEMMKFAVQPPKQRWEAIEEGLAHLNWQQDNYLKNYGFKIADKRTTVQARVLPAPDIQFKNDSLPGKMVGQGRWRIDGKKFLQHQNTIDSWGFFVLPGRGSAPKEAVERFASKMIQVWQKHGAPEIVKPYIGAFPGSGDFGDCIAKCWNTVGQMTKKTPKMMVFVMCGRDAQIYYRLKKTMDCRFGVPSQCLQSVHVMKAQDQYISNVLLKMNVKLGGANALAVAPPNTILKQVAAKSPKGLRLMGPKSRVMIIGADVSHGAPNSETPSIAALTMSKNLQCTKYLAVCDVNGNRFEIIQHAVMWRLREQIFQWMTMNEGRFPDHLIYLRDGVSEQQYSSVVGMEVQCLRDILWHIAGKQFDPKHMPKMVVIVASKRHHVRFFPESPGSWDRTGNPLPGTIVEKGVTHPFQNDFYLCAHQAIKGTARPVHYHVLANEDPDISNDELQQYLYMHSYQYCRSTTPVSLHPAIYYAHLASLRSKAHEDRRSESHGTPLDIWKNEIGRRQLKDQQNKKAMAEGKPRLYAEEEVLLTKEAIHKALKGEIPESFDPEHPERHDKADVRGRIHLLPLTSVNYNWFPHSMYFA